MCLIGFRFDPDGRQPLLLAANRDEFLSRPTAVAGWWSDAPGVYGGRDLQAGGTWMAISLPEFGPAGSRTCRFAALTNFRDGQTAGVDQRSRGELVIQLLTGALPLRQNMQAISARTDSYAGFNLIGFEWQEVRSQARLEQCRGWRLSNRGSETGTVRPIAPGTHGLSNGEFNEPWPKTRTLVNTLKQVDPDASREKTNQQLLASLTSQRPVPDQELPSTGLPTRSERDLACLFIRTALDTQTDTFAYGTRSSAVVRLSDSGRIAFEQWSWSAEAAEPRADQYRRMETDRL